MTPDYMGWWILDENDNPIRVLDGVMAYQWRKDHPERWKIAHTELPKGTVSTVFLMLNHQFAPDGPPLLYETMVFLPNTFHDTYCERYETKAEALAGHARVVQGVRDGSIEVADDTPDDEEGQEDQDGA